MGSGKIRTAKTCDYIALFSIYAIAFFLPISKGIIESFSILAIFSYLTKKFLNVETASSSACGGLPRNDRNAALALAGRLLPRTALNWGIAVYLLVCLLSIFLSSNTATSSRTLFRKTLQDIVFFFVILETLNNKQRIRNTLNILFLSSFVLGVDGIYQHFTTQDFLRHRRVIFTDRIYASFATPNAFGCYLAMVLPFLISRFFSKLKIKPSRIFYFALFVLLFVCLLLTVSRGAWLAFLASVLYMSIWLKGLAVFLLVMGIVILSTHTFYPPYVRGRLMKFFVFSDTSSIDRRLIWQAGWKMFISKPWLGVGLGTFMFNFRRFVVEGYPHGVVYAHNCYLQMAAEIGIIGLASFLLILAMFFYHGIKTLNARERSFSWHVLLASQAAILGYCAQMGVDTTFYSLDLGMLFWLALGIGVSAMKNLQSACNMQR